MIINSNKKVNFMSTTGGVLNHKKCSLSSNIERNERVKTGVTRPGFRCFFVFHRRFI